MATLRIVGHGEFHVPDGKRLVKAIEDVGVDILHRCGGNAKCTTCRVEFSEGEPARMTQAEHDKLLEKGDLGHCRLSCQCVAEDHMTVRPLMTVTSSGLDDPGPQPDDNITPDPEWIEAP